MRLSKKHFGLLFAIIFLLLGMKTYISKKQKFFKEVKVYNINDKLSDIKVSISISTELNSLIFETLEKIESVTFYDFNGKKISKETPQNNQISLDSLTDNQYYISFISKEKHSLKTIFLK